MRSRWTFFSAVSLRGWAPSLFKYETSSSEPERTGKNRKEPERAGKESGHISSIFGEIDHILEKLTQNATRGGIGSDRKAKTYKTEI